jgi:hypothetical protein
MGTKRPMSPNSSHSIEPCSSHRPFTSSCVTTDLSSALSPCKPQTTLLITPPIPTNHTPPTNSPYQPLALHVNVGSQPYTFPNSFNHAPLGHFSLHTLLVLTIGHDHTPLTYFHFFNTPLNSI